MNAKMKAVLNLLIVAAVSVALLFGMSAITDSVIADQEDEAARRAFEGLLSFDRLEAVQTGDAEGIRAAYRALDQSGNLTGYAVTVEVKGYGGELLVHAALKPDGLEFHGLRVGSHHETEGYGSRAAEESYTSRFAGLKAPLSLDGYTGIESTGTPPPSSSSAPAAAMKDGTYHAEETSYNEGYKYFLDMTVEGGKITAVNWDAYKENSDSTKKKESREGRYTMTETGKKWHEQAEIMEKALIEAGDPEKIVFSPDNGKTDAYAGVSVDVSVFVQLARNAAAQARGETSAEPAAGYADGTYKAEEDAYEEGYKQFVEVTVQDGKITAVNWDAYKEDSDSTKKKESEEGRYTMTETGKKWHEQAEIMEKALIEAGDPDKIVFSPDDGKTDAYAGVSIDVSPFVKLASAALEQAHVTKTDTTPQENGDAVDGVSGATVTSKAIVKAANLAYLFVQTLI